MATEQVVLEEPVRRGPSPAVVAAIVAGSLLLLGALFFFVILPLLGGDDPDTTFVPSPRVRAEPAPSPTPTPPPPETFEVFESKDPFRPLVVEAPEGSSGAGAGGGAGTGTGGTGTGTGTGTGGTGGATGGTGAGAGGGSAPTGGQRVQLLDVFSDDGGTKAQIRVGSTVFTVSPGEVFADNFKLLSTSGNCATLLHGDDKFTLCEGEEVFK